MARIAVPDIRPARPLVAIEFDGEPIAAYEGESIAAALTAAGHHTFRRTREEEPRGLFCGMGVCYDCLVAVDGQPNRRACMTSVTAGMRVETQPHIGPPPGSATTTPGPAATAVPCREVEVLVVGAGPAGLAAARAAAAAGARVVVLDERAKAGGQFFKPLAETHAFCSPAAMDAQFRQGAELIGEVEAAGVELVAGATVWGAFPPNEIAAVVGGGAEIFRPRQLILATGAHERPVPMPGWTLPGVMTTGAAQTLVRSYRVSPGRRVVLAGNGPLNLQVAAELVAGGVEIAAVVEAAEWPGWRRLGALIAALASSPDLIGDGLRYLLRVCRAGVPVLWGHTVVAAAGDGAVETVTVARIGPDGRPAPGSERTLAADALCLGYGFVPNTELARLLGCRHRYVDRGGGYLATERDANGETSVAGIFVAGDGGDVGGARVALEEGALAGHRAAANLGRRLPDAEVRRSRHRARLARQRAFQRALWRLYDSPAVADRLATDDTTLCRCESVTLASFKRHLESGVTELAFLKKLTRAGMGRCQGRYCGPLLARLAAGGEPVDEHGFFAPRPPVKPVAVAALACEKPEWAGYNRVAVPAIPPPTGRAAATGSRRVETLVIGGGILGWACAHALARTGCEVLVIDAADTNAQSSGANAGSLHVQLTSKDFGDRADAGSARAADTLPLGKEAVRLWKDIAAAVDRDIEFAITGGLMVAETAADMRLLEAKIAVERRRGVASELLGREDLRRLAPYISERMAGAELCREEGKVNPLVATPALARLARSAGVEFWRHTTVHALMRESGRLVATTDRGSIRARRVVNAAGAWSPSIAAMVGIRLPVSGGPIQMLVTEPTGPVVAHLVAHASRHLTLKQAANGNLIIGGAWPAALNPRTGGYDVLRDSIEGSLWVAAEVVPRLKHLHLLRSWAGMNVVIDGAPVLGEAPSVPGFYNAVSASGYTLAPVIARLTAELITTGRASMDVRPFAIERFS